ncbi:MAG: GH116 family glycosyl-hydrolase [Planctomycetota bacterium]|jgi:uncharacterized protein (DUF608 family)
MSRFIYTGRRTSQISFPLGGIGTGCIGLAGNGRLVDWEIFNRPSKGSVNGFSHFAVRAERDGKVIDARVLQGDLPPPYIGEMTATKYSGFGFGPKREFLAGAPHFESVTFRGEFPVAELEFEGGRFPGRARMRAFNPLVPLQADDSGIPAAFFEIEIENTTGSPLDYTVVGAVSNPLKETNVNRVTKEDGLTLLRLSSDGYAKGEPGAGDLTLATDAEGTSFQEYWFRGAWFDNLEVYWKDLNTPGPFANRRYEGESAGKGTTGMLGSRVSAAPGETVRVRYVIAWCFPVCHKYWDSDPDEVARRAKEKGVSPTWRNHYATVWEDSAAAARHALAEWDRLHAETMAFKDALFASDLPEAALEAVSANLSLMKSATVRRLEDGTLYGWEGCHATAGCCEGSCTHVWNYAQAFPFLFPALERSMREANYRHNQDSGGGMHFRMQLPLGIGHSPFRPCCDGQFGDVIKTYRDWKVSGDDEWLGKLWPAVKRSIEYAWSEANPDRWDPEKTGVLQGRQHHTLDMELFGPNSWLTGLYLAALKAGAEMADRMNDAAFADTCHDLFGKGSAWVDEHLFNGEYYQQLVDLEDRSILERFDAMNYWNEEHGEIKYQTGEGSGLDQVLAQWHANLYGLGRIFDPEQVKTALASVFRYNFRPEMREHFNACRLFALNDESGLVICEWPEGRRRPVTPAPYSGEVMDGFAWASSIHMIQEGLVEEGMKGVESIRDRYDGERRNPWNEIECGSNYARSMASYALLNAFSGFEFDMTRGHVGFAPVGEAAHAFRCFFCLDAGWGTYSRRGSEAGPEHAIAVARGGLKLKSVALKAIDGARVTSASASVAGREVACSFEQEGDRVVVTLAEETCVATGEELVVGLGW